MKAEEERKKKEAEDEAEKRRKEYRPPSGLKNKVPINNQTNNTKPNYEPPMPSLSDMDSMEDALEEMIEGGGF